MNKYEFPKLHNCFGCKKLKHRTLEEKTEYSSHEWKCTEKKMGGVVRMLRVECPFYETEHERLLENVDISEQVIL